MIWIQNFTLDCFQPCFWIYELALNFWTPANFKFLSFVQNPRVPAFRKSLAKIVEFKFNLQEMLIINKTQP